MAEAAEEVAAPEAEAKLPEPGPQVGAQYVQSQVIYYCILGNQSLLAQTRGTVTAEMSSEARVAIVYNVDIYAGTESVTDTWGLHLTLQLGRILRKAHWDACRATVDDGGGTEGPLRCHRCGVEEGVCESSAVKYYVGIVGAR